MSRLIVFMSILALNLMASTSSAEDLNDCLSDEFPKAHLSVYDKGSGQGSFSLLINLESPEQEPNVRLSDRFVNEPNSAGEVILSDSYIHGLKLRMVNGQWRGELQLFERERPIIFNCR